jgi:protein phosphatase
MASINKFDCHGLTDPGQIRGVNDDQFLIADLRKSIFVHQTSVNLDEHAPIFGGTQSRLLMVADGGGGWTAERQASEIVVHVITQYVLNMMPWLYRLDTQSEDDFLDDLTTALERCQDRIRAVADATTAPREIGTTLTIASISWPRLYVVHVGNGRCYLLRRGVLEQITTDHTLAQQLVESGMLGQGEAASSQLSQVLWNAIGGDLEELNPDVYKAELQLGDTLLLCTDGLTAHVPDAVIRRYLQVQESAQDTCRKLINAANEAGGTDNITAIVARFDRDAQSVDDAIEAMADDDAPQAFPEPINAGDQEPAAIPQPASAECIAGKEV